MPARLTQEVLQIELAHLERMLAITGDDAPTARLMWDQRLKVVRQQIESLETSSDKTLASVALVFDGSPVIGTRDIRADFSSRIIGEYQHLVSAIFADHVAERLRDKGPIPHASRSRLFVAEIAHGSMGFILEEAPRDQSEMIDTPLKEAVEAASTLLHNLASEEIGQFEQSIASLKPRVFKAVRDVAKTLNDFAAETRIVGQDSIVELPRIEAQRLHERLTDVIVSEERTVQPGLLTGLLPDRLSFEFRPDDGGGADLYGTVSDEMADQYVVNASNLVQKHGIASFLTFSTIRSGRVVNKQFVLEDFTPD